MTLAASKLVKGFPHGTPGWRQAGSSCVLGWPGPLGQVQSDGCSDGQGLGPPSRVAAVSPSFCVWGSLRQTLISECVLIFVSETCLLSTLLSLGQGWLPGDMGPQARRDPSAPRSSPTLPPAGRHWCCRLARGDGSGSTGFAAPTEAPQESSQDFSALAWGVTPLFVGMKHFWHCTHLLEQDLQPFPRLWVQPNASRFHCFRTFPGPQRVLCLVFQND